MVVLCWQKIDNIDYLAAAEGIYQVVIKLYMSPVGGKGEWKGRGWGASLKPMSIDHSLATTTKKKCTV